MDGCKKLIFNRFSRRFKSAFLCQFHWCWSVITECNCVDIIIKLISSVQSENSPFHNLMTNYPVTAFVSSHQRSLMSVSPAQQEVTASVFFTCTPTTHWQHRLQAVLSAQDILHVCLILHHVSPLYHRSSVLSVVLLWTPDSHKQALLSCVMSTSRTPARAGARGALLCHLFQEGQGQCSVLKLSR